MALGFSPAGGLCDRFSRRWIEEMGVAEIAGEGDCFIYARAVCGWDANNDGAGMTGQVEVGFRPHWLDEFDGGLEDAFRQSVELGRAAGDVLRAEAQYHRLAEVSPKRLGERRDYPEHERGWRGRVVAGGFLEHKCRAFLPHGALEEVHRRGTDKPGHKEVGRMLVQSEGRGDLLDGAILHDRDAVAEGQGFDLVMSDVDHRRAETGLEPGDFGAHLEAAGGVEIGEGLVEEEQAGAADEGAAKRDALPLAAGQGRGPAVETSGEPEDLRGVLHAPIGFRAGEMPELQAKGQVVIDRHVRIEGKALEDHRHIAVFGGQVVDGLAGDGDGAVAGFFEAGNQAQGGGLAAARGAHQREQFPVANFETGNVHGAKALARRAREDFAQMLQENLCHVASLGAHRLKVEAESR